MSTESQGKQRRENDLKKGGISQVDVVEELALPSSWEVVELTERDGILLVERRGQKQWQSISFSITHRKEGDKINARYRKAPYRKDRVGPDPVERDTLSTWADAIEWAQSQLR
jgi:hypothetical protein